jgi:ubiquinone/menaquinone biosynthesis C-methylase UbiE
MELNKIIALIKNGVDQNHQRQVWADLGAGSGAFTVALSTLLQRESKIYAIDKNVQSLSQISVNSTIELIKLNQDLNDFLYFDEPLNGILLANALHYIQDKASLINSLRSKLTEGGRIVIVEYDIVTGNQWVPFPISFDELKKLTSAMGFKHVVKLAEVPSQYHRSMYSALLS